MSYVTVKKDGELAIITLDQPGEKVNVLTRELLDDFRGIVDDLESDDSIRAAVLISAKEDSFIAGADIKLFQEFTSSEEVETFSREGNQLLRRMASSSKPVIAAIHGATLGGGLEVALACHYRIATNHPKTKFALPEVQLGLLPGGGGTQRLPRLIGISGALDMMLTGRNIFSRSAKKMGLVDELVHQHGLLDAAKNTAKRFAGEGVPDRSKGGKMPEKLLERTSPGRKIIYSQAKKKVMSQTRGNMPAPLEILECVKTGMEKGFDAGLREESRRFGELAFTPESRQLVRLYFAMQEAKKNPDAKKVQPVDKIGVLGAGLMGSGIADVSAQRGYNVVLKDQDQKSAARGLKSIWKELDKKVQKRIINSFDRDQQISRITPTDDYSYLRDTDLVIEAVFEDLKLKQQVLADVESTAKPTCIFASNTSSLPIHKIAEKAQRPELVLGMHYFSPVQKMPLLEIITTEKTADWVTATAAEVGIRQGKHVIIVSDGPGFYTTRILVPFMNEALNLLLEGAEIGSLDSAMRNFGFPVGPAALMDEVGLDVAAHVGDVMQPVFEKRGTPSDNYAKVLLDVGYKGRKNNQGFYDYSGRKKQINDEIYEYIGGERASDSDEGDIQERLSLMMINEAVYCLQENIIKSPQDGDLGAILGLGFPPFLGGPFRYIDAHSASTIVERMEYYREMNGKRFAPAPLLEEYAKGDKKFYKD